MKPVLVVASLLFLSLARTTANAQSVTGQISGTVTDPAGAVIAGATARLTNDLTNAVRTFTTEGNGTFIFIDLVPGDYSVHITFPGFKAYEQKGINVSTQEKVALHDIRLAIGDVSSSVTVQADVAHVATDSSDRDFLVNSTQIENTPIRGRDWLGLIQALPGVVDLNNHDVPGWNSGTPTINGGQTGQLNITLSGVVSQDSGAPQANGYLAPNVDAIGEVKVLISNYSAQYGSRAGGQLNVSIRNGTRQFHGSLFYFFRHEFLNANEYFSNQAGLDRPLYRYQNEGGTVGGPLLFPGTRFNRSRTKLFFFFSEDYLRFTLPGTLSKYTMPTALERRGDFSQTTTTTAKLISIKDPSTGKQFPGNLIPISRISAAGSAMLNLFPLPFTTDPTGQRQYNAIFQYGRRDPHEDRIVRLDYNIAPRTQAFVVLMNDFQADRGGGNGAPSLTATLGWNQLATNYSIQSASAVGTIIHTFRPNLINEFTFGLNRAHQIVSVANQDQFAANQLPALKGPDGQQITLAHFYNNNSYNLIPNIRFTGLSAQAAGQGITNPPAFTFDSRFPFNGTDQIENVTDTVSWIKGGHSLKFGFYFERMARNVTIYSLYNTNGSYYFGSDTASPFDTGYPYSNLFTGAVQAYGEDNGRLVDHARYNQVEWFAQDSWRFSRHVTVDLGVRFQYPGAFSSAGATLSFFDRAHYDPAKSGQLLWPAQVSGQSVSLNPATGAVYQLARGGFFDPTSYPNGSPYSGMVQYKDRAYHNPGLALGPRVGFAWDVLGNGKLALRGGFGIFYDRFTIAYDSATSAGVGPQMAPPIFQAPVYYNTTVTQLVSAQGFMSPQSVYAGTSYKNPSTYNWSLGLQRDLTHALVLDVSYVGNVVHHKFVQVDTNLVPPYTTWTVAHGINTAYVDPTSAGKAFYTANLLRPIIGYGAINTACSCGEANYHSLQTQLNRRFGKRLQFGANFTWSKTMSYTRYPFVPDYLNYAEVAASRPQVFNMNYSYRLPDGSRIWKNAVTKTAFDGWRFNGITKFLSGNPLTVACTAAGAPIGYWTGTPAGTGTATLTAGATIPFRCQMGSSASIFLAPGSPLPANAPHGRYYALNAANFKLPPVNSLGIGNTPPTMFHGPGFENFDFSLLKETHIGKEGRILEFRAEAFNIFNHFNRGNPNTSLTLNYTSGANTNANFGTITTAIGQARHVALGMKFRF